MFRWLGRQKEDGRVQVLTKQVPEDELGEGDNLTQSVWRRKWGGSSLIHSRKLHLEFVRSAFLTHSPPVFAGSSFWQTVWNSGFIQLPKHLPEMHFEEFFSTVLPCLLQNKWVDFECHPCHQRTFEKQGCFSSICDNKDTWSTLSSLYLSTRVRRQESVTQEYSVLMWIKGF